MDSIGGRSEPSHVHWLIAVMELPFSVYLWSLVNPAYGISIKDMSRPISFPWEVRPGVADRMVDDNAFGKLVRVRREERQWKQDELAERLGFTRQYVSQIERGKRRLDNPEQVTRLATILDITPEQLTHAGKRIPSKWLPPTQQSAECNDLLLQALLQPAERIVQHSWLAWQDHAPYTVMIRNLHGLGQSLKDTLAGYHGQFREPALHLLASVHECLAKQAIDKTATEEASAHIQQMYDIAEELDNRDLLILAMIHQAAMFRRTRRFEAAFRRLSAAEKRAGHAPDFLQGLLWKTSARTFAVYGDEREFLHAIDQAERIVNHLSAEDPTMPYLLDQVGVLQERAQGYGLLWQPEKARALCREIDQLRPFRPPRQQSALHILKAQTYCLTGNLQTGMEHARTGLRIAEMLQSKRYVMRLRQMCERLRDKSVGRSRALQDLHSEILIVWDKLGKIEQHPVL